MPTKPNRKKDDPKTRERTSTDHVETEWQFEAADLAVVEEWLKRRASVPALSIEPRGTRDIHDTYLDTEDWRVYRAGYALRVREAGGELEATMKALASDDKDGARRRREVSAPLKNAGALTNKTSGPVGRRLHALTGSPRGDHTPKPLFEVRTRRSVFELRRAAPGNSAENGASGKQAALVGEVALDDSEIIIGDDGEKTLLRRVEVEAWDGEVSALREFAAQMREEILGLEPASRSKYEAGLSSAGLTPDFAPDFGSTEVKRSMMIGELAFAVLRRQFTAMLAHEPGVRLGDDPEALHDMRVATRRIRAAMKVFKIALPERRRWLVEELKFFAGALGKVRDLDVLIEDTTNRTIKATEEDREPLEKISEALDKDRSKARDTMLEALDSERYERFLEYFAAMLREGPEDRAGTATPAAAVGRAVVFTARRKWLKAVKRIKKNSPPEAYHDVRKKGKRLRYALEFLSGVYGKKATSGLVKPLKKLQDVLGAQQDAIVAAKILRGLAVSRRRFSRAAVFTMGKLAERRERETHGVRSGFRSSKAFETLTKDRAWKDFDKETKPSGKARG